MGFLSHLCLPQLVLAETLFCGSGVLFARRSREQNVFLHTAIEQSFLRRVFLIPN
jgi:hypothetical protein